MRLAFVCGALYALMFYLPRVLGILRVRHDWNYIRRRRKKTEGPICKNRAFRFLVEWSRLSCCGFGFSDFSDDAELLHQA